MQYFKIKDIHVFGDKNLVVRIHNITDNVLRIRSTKLYAVFPRPIEVKRIFGIIRILYTEKLIGTMKGISSKELKPDEECNIDVELNLPFQVLEKHLMSKYGWEGLCKFLFESELIVGYARTLLESRVEVRKEFKAEVTFRIKDRNIYDISSPRYIFTT